ncbi:MAG: GNAT family N-acetyltransferase [Candidatus Thorarchaeota archaeon]|nr:GNAT family N-acetyltransferase [Candidatus Thorarchaeota archaeon]
MKKNELKIAERDRTILRYARQEDFPQIDKITAICYKAIHESWVSMQGEDIYNALRNPEISWEERKAKQNHELFAEHPEYVWVLENDDDLFGFVTFKLDREIGYGLLDNNGVLPQYAGKGWGKFMYRHVLQYLRAQNIKIAIVETGLDDPHIPARSAYESVGFDRSAPVVYYWQDLRKNNPGSIPDDQ